VSAGIYYAIFVVLVTLGIASFNLVPLVRQHFRNQHIVADGVLAPATIIALRDTGSRVNGQPVAAIQLEVSPVGAPPFEATARSVITPINTLQFVPGRTVQVKYDPSYPTYVVVVGGGP
jgi:hypothetical protein